MGTLLVLQLLKCILGKGCRLIRELLDGDVRDYWHLQREVKLRYFRKFAFGHLVESVSRLTVEMFSGEVKEEEEEFRLADILASNGIGYRVVDYGYLVEKKKLGKRGF